MKTLLLAFGALLIAAFSACGKKSDGAGAHSEHVHTAPHGGTLVELGDHAYNVELVRDHAAGKLTAYVLDGHAENFVRIKSPGIELIAMPVFLSSFASFAASREPPPRSPDASIGPNPKPLNAERAQRTRRKSSFSAPFARSAFKNPPRTIVTMPGWIGGLPEAKKIKSSELTLEVLRREMVQTLSEAPAPPAPLLHCT